MANSQSERVFALYLSEEEAQWLCNYLQNYHGSGFEQDFSIEDEPDDDLYYRSQIFSALHDALENSNANRS